MLEVLVVEDIFRPLARIEADERDRARLVLGVALDVEGRVVVVVPVIPSIRVMGEGGRVEVLDNET